MNLEAVDVVKGSVVMTTEYPFASAGMVFLTQYGFINNRIDYYNNYLNFSSFLLPPSPYQYLFVNGKYFGDFPTDSFDPLKRIQLINSTTNFQDPLLGSEYLTGLTFSLCNDTNQTSCIEYTSPSLGVLSHQEQVWVIFTEELQLQLTARGNERFVTPEFVNSYYNITSNVGSPFATQLVYEGDGQVFSPQALTYFQEELNIPVHGIELNINGIFNDTFCRENFFGSCLEPVTQVDALMATSQYPSPTIYFYDLGSSPLVGWLHYVATTAELPLVHFITYFLPEADLSPTLVYIFTMELIKVRVSTSFVTHLIFNSFRCHFVAQQLSAIVEIMVHFPNYYHR